MELWHSALRFISICSLGWLPHTFHRLEWKQAMQASTHRIGAWHRARTDLPISYREIFGLLLLLATALFGTDSAMAQTCNADFDCRRLMPLGGGARCIGDTLISTTTRCVAGRCQTRETMRRNCATQGTGRCVGEYYERTSGRCDGSSGRCVTRTDREPCRRGCSCRGNVLIVFTGSCSSGIGCHRAVKKCSGGCSCEPEPVCREDAPPDKASEP